MPYFPLTKAFSFISRFVRTASPVTTDHLFTDYYYAHSDQTNGLILCMLLTVTVRIK